MERICGRYPWVGKDVNVILKAWRETWGVPYGRSITAAMRFAASHPDFKLPIKTKKK